MAKAEAVLEKLAGDVCEGFGVYVYDTEYKKEGGSYYLRLFIDKDGGVTIEDCENVSRALNPMLDAFEVSNDPYVFEVSSPGMDRRLSRDWHFEKAIGQPVLLKLFAPRNGSKEITGTLTHYDHGVLTLETENGTEQIEKGKTALCRLAL